MKKTTRKTAAAACKAEAATAIRFADSAIRKAAEGLTTAAWSLADTARTAATCAMQAHEELWDLAVGQLTASELEAFEAAEIAVRKADEAARAAAASVARR